MASRILKKRTELILNAIYKIVKIEFYDGDFLIGWLVPSLYFNGHYELLPLNEFECISTFCITHIKHIYFLNNGYKLW